MVGFLHLLGIGKPLGESCPGGVEPVPRECPAMKYLHTMIRVTDVEQSLHFFCELLGMTVVRRKDSEAGRYTLIYLAADEDRENAEKEVAPTLELTYNWDPEEYTGGRNFGHLAYRVKNIYETCQRLMDNGVTINRPPRDGHMAFFKAPDGISIELLQEGDPLPPQEPWASMPSTGTW
jgi:lactoylglutathione lyase